MSIYMSSYEVRGRGSDGMERRGWRRPSLAAHLLT
jgi:hypothetical protein